MMIARVLILILICQSTYAQDFFSKSLLLKINEDSLLCIGSCKVVTISFRLVNNSDEDVLIYGLKRGGPIPSFNGLSDLCDVKRTGTGMQFALYHPDGTEEMAEFEISDSFRQRPVKKEMIDSVLRQMKEDFLKSAMIIKGHEEKSFVKELPLHQYNLEKGLYYLEMLYYCGTNTAEALDLNEVSRSGAKLFQGCATSARIPFVVR